MILIFITWINQLIDAFNPASVNWLGGDILNSKVDLIIRERHARNGKIALDYQPTKRLLLGNGYQLPKLVSVFYLTVFCNVFVGGCGIRPSSRIVGGVAAQHGDWPWQGMLRSSSGFPYCGGTLVAPQWFISASHCVSGKLARSVFVR